MLSSPEVVAATSDDAWLQAMLDVESALACAAASVGLAPPEAAARIAAACRLDRVDSSRVAEGWARDATPVVALVAELRAAVGTGDADYVHVAATSQDVVDSALALVVRRAVAAAAPDLRAVADLLAGIVERHRDTPQIGRTLLQHAALTTFGAAWAVRLAAVDDTALALSDVVANRLTAQLGGAVGTLSAAGDRGLDLLDAFARELDLPAPALPWHVTRGRVADVACRIAEACGELAGVAQDVVLLSATEIGELRVASPGASSAMPGKRNPAPAVLALAAHHRVPGLAATVLAGMPQALQRSAGHWQAEWATLTDLLRLLGGVARHTRRALDGIDVDQARMRDNVVSFVGTEPGDGVGMAGALVDRALRRHRTAWGR